MIAPATPGMTCIQKHVGDDGPAWDLTLCRQSEIRAAVDSLLRAMSPYAYSVSDVFAVHLAVTEALANAVEHGNLNDPTKRVRMRWSINRHEIFVEVRDEGAGFNPAAVAAPLGPQILERERGRGLFLMNTYMTSVEFDDSGSHVKLRRLQGRGATLAGPPHGYDYQI